MNRIRELRIARGWKQDDLGRVLNVGKGAVSRYEKELRQLDPATICALCDLFGCSADYLLGRSATPLPALSDEDARLLEAFHSAPPETQAAIRLLILPPAVPEKRAVS